MKKFLPVLLVLLCLYAQAYGQLVKKGKHPKKSEFIQDVDKINSLLKLYSTLSPFSHDENSFDRINSTSEEITVLLLKVLNNPEILKFQIENLFTEDELFISKSEDNRLYFFSIDEKTGGSYRTSITIIHYRFANGIVKARLFGGEETDALASSTFGQIYLLDSVAEKYFVMGRIQTCNTCIFALALTIQLAENTLNTEIIANYDGRYYDLEVFNFDNEQKELKIEFYAAESDDSLYGDENEISGYRHKFVSRYKYLEGVFIETEKCELRFKGQ